MEITIGILGILLIGAFFYSRNLTQELEEEKKKSWDNLGKGAPLKDAGKKLYGHPETLSSPEFLLQGFVPIKEHVNPKVAPDMYIGTGLLAHPDYPNYVACFHILFQFGEEIHIDGVTRYVLQQDPTSDLHYLQKK